MWVKSLSRLQLAVIAGTLLYACGFVLMLLAQPGSKYFYSVLSNGLQTLPPFFAGVSSIIYVRYGEHPVPVRRAGWMLIGCGSILWAIGQAIYTYYTIREETVFPSLADVSYLSAYPCLVVGVALLFGGMPVAGRTRLLLDSAIAASSVGLLSWYFVVGRLWQQSNVPFIGKMLSVAYPLGDVAVLFSALVLFNGATTNRTKRLSFGFLCLGMTLVVMTDTIWNLYTLNGAYETGSWFDPGWPIGFLLIGYASLIPLWWPSESVVGAGAPTASPSLQSLESQGVQSLARSLSVPMLLRVFIPYLAAAAAFSIVAIHDLRQRGHISNSVLGAGLWLIGLVIARQVLTLLENGYLAAQLQDLNSRLEHLVDQRTAQLSSLTQQLSSLLELTKAINNTLKVNQVLETAAQYTQQTLQADAVVVRLLADNGAVANDLSPGFIHRGLEQKPQTLRFLEELPVPTQAEVLALPTSLPDEPSAGAVYLQAPLVWQSQKIGVLGVIRWDHTHTFGRNDSELLESIGVEVGAALENARVYAAALEAADRDSVTDLYNHRAIHQRLDSEFHRAERQNRPLTVIMMDLNNFRLFNDTYGHPVGDQVLRRVAEVLLSESRKCDFLGRYGGDEFIAILPDTDVPLAMVVAQRLRNRMSMEGFQHSSQENTVPVSLSFGIATFPTDCQNRYELVAMADANLYTAKISEIGIMGTSDTQRSHRELRTDGAFDVLEAMVTAVDNKDRYTRRHSEDVTEYAMWTASEMGFSEETMRIIRIGALLHDVGKIGVPEDVLRKPGKLTEEEYEVMKRHPQLGALIVSGMPGMEAIVDIVRSHHERWDGKGYPDGLAGEGIPVLGRLLAVADAFSAMTTARPYRKGMDWDVTVEEIRKNMSTQFDPEMAQAFITSLQKRRPLGLVPSPKPAVNGTNAADKAVPGSSTFSSSRRRSSDKSTRTSNIDSAVTSVVETERANALPPVKSRQEEAHNPAVERRNLS